jgi:hypothetical protein
VGAFRSTDGGASWTDVTTIALIDHHTEAGKLRSPALPTAEIDEAGKVFVAWSDSRFERGRANDIVFSSSTDGFTWSAVTRVPIDAIKSGVDHFIPGLAVDKATSRWDSLSSPDVLLLPGVELQPVEVPTRRGHHLIGQRRGNLGSLHNGGGSYERQVVGQHQSGVPAS